MHCFLSHYFSKSSEFESCFIFFGTLLVWVASVKDCVDFIFSLCSFPLSRIRRFIWSYFIFSLCTAYNLTRHSPNWKYTYKIYIYSYCSNGIIHCAHVRTRTWTEHDNQYYKDFIFSCSECVWFFSSTLFFSFLFIKYQYTRTYSYRNEKNIPFLQMFVGSCAHININTSAKAPHYKSTGTFCLVAFLYNYKAAHCDKKNRFSFCMPHSHAIYVFALLCFTLLCCARWVG